MLKLHLFLYLFDKNTCVLSFKLCWLFLVGLISFLGLKGSLFCLVTLACNTIYRHGGHLGHVTWIFIYTLVSPSYKCFV